MNGEYEAHDSRVDSGPDDLASARLKEERRKLDRRHSDVLKTATFLGRIPQATWLAAMVDLEIAAPEMEASSGPTQMSFPFEGPDSEDETWVARESNPEPTD